MWIRQAGQLADHMSDRLTGGAGAQSKAMNKYVCVQ